jgi:hypothetical protein
MVVVAVGYHDAFTGAGDRLVVRSPVVSNTCLDRQRAEWANSL